VTLKNQEKTAGNVYIAVGLVLLVSVVFVPASLRAKLICTVAGIFIVFMGWRLVRDLKTPLE
jgi:VIT1/CCC1 family predicted Fe2+/Mn2+ transporter